MARTVTPRFSVETVRLLRALKRNNDRDWFRARRDRYDQFVRAPMVNVIDQCIRSSCGYPSLIRLLTPIFSTRKTRRYTEIHRAVTLQGWSDRALRG
jgi:hypothetical protein